jgi:hypothetical protein
VFKNRVLWRTFEPKGDEVIGKWRNMPIKELHELYVSSNNIQVIKSRIRRVGHVVGMGKKERCIQCLGGEL